MKIHKGNLTKEKLAAMPEAERTIFFDEDDSFPPNN